MSTNFFIKNKTITCFFVFSTLFFLFQHTTGISWDFSAYVLNAKYIFSGGYYMEWYRSPLPSFLIFVFSPFSYLMAEYLYIIFVSFLYLFACIKFAEKYKLDKRFFYALSLSVFVLFYGLQIGTELLSLTTILLFLAYIDEKKAGFFLGLAFLARYTNIIFLPLLLFQRDWKKIVSSILLLLLVLSPWLFYNQIQTGSPLTSIVNSYALNVKYRREYMFNPFDPFHLLLIVNFLAPAFILGLFQKIKKIDRDSILMILVLALGLLSYANLPHKEARYLFTIIVPIVYFSVLYISKLKHKEILFYCIILINLIAVLLFMPLSFLENPTPYTLALSSLDNCALKSNAWVQLNYFGKPAEPFPRKGMINDSINQGYRIVLFKYVTEPDYTRNGSFLKQFPIIMENDDFYVLGNKTRCKEMRKIDETYLEKLDSYVYQKHGYHIETDPLKFLISEVV